MTNEEADKLEDDFRSWMVANCKNFKQGDNNVSIEDQLTQQGKGKKKAKKGILRLVLPLMITTITKARNLSLTIAKLATLAMLNPVTDYNQQFAILTFLATSIHANAYMSIKHQLS